MNNGRRNNWRRPISEEDFRRWGAKDGLDTDIESINNKATCSPTWRIHPKPGYSKESMAELALERTVITGHGGLPIPCSHRRPPSGRVGQRLF